MGVERTLAKQIKAKGGEMTKAVLTPNDKHIVKAGKEDFEKIRASLMDGDKFNDYARPVESKIFTGKLTSKTLEPIRVFNNKMLEAEDGFFMKYAYSRAFAKYCKANNINPAKMTDAQLSKARRVATNDALMATYRDMNSFSSWLSRTKQTLHHSKGVGKKAGGIILEGIVPFAKTPVNILRRGIEYSPIGLGTGVIDMYRALKKGTVNPNKAIEELCSGLTGTGILGLGALFAALNMATGKNVSGTTDKEQQYSKMLGEQAYALQLGDYSYTVDWAAPASLTFFTGVEIFNLAKEKGASLGQVLDALSGITDPMMNMSMLQGLNDLVSYNFDEDGVVKGLTNTAYGYAGQYVPTLFGQVARTVDNTRRTTASTNESKFIRFLQKNVNKQINKIPFASKTSEPYVDLWGRTQKNGNILEQFASPGYYGKKNVTDVDRELQNLASRTLDETDRNSLFPSSAKEYDLMYSKGEYRMTDSDLTLYNKTKGQYAYSELQKLFQTNAYKYATRDEQVDLVKNVYKNAAEEARVKVLSGANVASETSLRLESLAEKKAAAYNNVKNTSAKEYVSTCRFVKDTCSALDVGDDNKTIGAMALAEYGADNSVYSAWDKENGSQTLSDKRDAAKRLVQKGYTSDDISRMLKEANQNKSTTINQDEARDYVDSLGIKDRQEKRDLWRILYSYTRRTSGRRKGTLYENPF